MEDDIFDIFEDSKILDENYPLFKIKEIFYSPDTYILKVDNIEIRVQTQAIEYWRKSKQWEEAFKEAKPLEYISDFCFYLKEFCTEFSFQYNFFNMLIVSDDYTTQRPISSSFHLDDVGVHGYLVYIPKIYFDYRKICLLYAFSHEFSHWWVFPTIYLPKDWEEYFRDLIAFCILENMFPDEWEKQAKVLEMCSYIGHAIKNKNDKIPREALERPKEFLRKELKKYSSQH